LTECSLAVRLPQSTSDILGKNKIARIELFDKSVGKAGNRTADEKKLANSVVSQFVDRCKESSVFVFTDGAVLLYVTAQLDAACVQL